MLVYRYDEITSEFVGSEEAFLDPLETENSGKHVFLLPANCTYDPPLEYKEGFKIVWEDSKWAYKEIVTVSETEKEPTPEQLKQRKISELQNYLSSTDWYITRFSERGTPVPEDVLDARESAREEISRLRETV